ncbi:MAG: hypothetical protein A2293_13965 [Elusimicrobia bacterium RIFOXYB2_FULL_49_7]|nr:MAG: hypothetical protein A2293_13965 [Elusimicrobia bacterium RIFOXYB2_FULL_49_7]
MVTLTHLTKRFNKGGQGIAALNDVSLTLAAGTWTTITGKSGSGKSTLLYVIAGLLKPTSGTVVVDGEDVPRLSGAGRAAFRGRKIGFIFQSFHLFPHLTVLQNVLMSGGRFGADASAAQKLLERLDLSDRAGHYPSELSVGEKQRVAIGRAVLCRPALILADEATGNLDRENGDAVIHYLRGFKAEGMSVVFVTHKAREEFQAFTDQFIILDKGRRVNV